MDQLKIIDEEVYQRAQEVLAARNIVNARKSNIAYTTRGVALLSGNIYCAHCQSRLHASSYTTFRILADGTKKVYRQIKYLCPNRARGRGRCDGLTEYTATRIDETVLNIVHELLTKIKSSEKDDTFQAKFQEIVKQKKAKYNALLKEHEKEQHILTKLIEEIGRAMIGESRLSIEDINQAVTIRKANIAKLEELIPVALKEVNDNQGTLKNLDAYERFARMGRGVQRGKS